MKALFALLASLFLANASAQDAAADATAQANSGDIPDVPIVELRL